MLQQRQEMRRLHAFRIELWRTELLTIEKRDYCANHSLARAIKGLVEGVAIDCVTVSAVVPPFHHKAPLQYQVPQKGHCHSLS